MEAGCGSDQAKRELNKQGAGRLARAITRPRCGPLFAARCWLLLWPRLPLNWTAEQFSARVQKDFSAFKKLATDKNIVVD